VTWGIEAKVITSETNPKHVKGDIIHFLKATSDIAGGALLITWSAYIDLPYFHRRENWRIIIDEVPQVDRFYPLMLPHSYGLLAEHLQPLPSTNTDLYLIKSKNSHKLK